jgi:Mn2+/Fe2+ NRAMP family transporter
MLGRRFGPGLLLAATGVGAGDLATAAFAGQRLGTTVLWAVVLGAALKWVLTEGIARWQMARGTPLLEGLADAFGRPVLIGFLAFLLLWSYFVGAALISAAGVAAQALWPLAEDPVRGKQLWGGLQSLIAGGLVLLGGFGGFARLMKACIALMFVVVLVSAAAQWPGTTAVIDGLLQPQRSLSGAAEARWTLALMGGVGGTVTLLCYGYWLRESEASAPETLPGCRIDLALGYGMTALFGLAMVIIGSGVTVEGSGANLLVALAVPMEDALGPLGRWAFLIGAWAAIFSSLVGVWQAVPYLYADSLRLLGLPSAGPLSQSPSYRLALAGLMLLPMAGLFGSFRSLQLLYGLVGAAFLPLLAAALLCLNNRAALGPFRNGWASNLALVGCLLFFAGLGVVTL